MVAMIFQMVYRCMGICGLQNFSPVTSVIEMHLVQAAQCAMVNAQEAIDGDVTEKETDTSYPLQDMNCELRAV
jgi:hypothetical protein